MKGPIAALALLIGLAPGLSSAQFANISAPSGGAKIPNFTANGGLPHWQSVRQNVIAGTGNAQIVTLGDSTEIGNGAFFDGVLNEARPFSWPVQITSMLRLYGINAHAATLFGMANVATTTAALRAYDARWPTINSWIAINDATGNPGSWLNTSDTTKLTFNPSDNSASFPSAVLNTNTIDIYGYVGGGVGAFNVDVGGSSLGSCVPTQIGTTALGKCTFTTGVAAANNNWNIACNPQNGFCAATALRAYDNTTKEVSIFNGGFDGAYVSNFTGTGGSPAAAYWLNLVNVISPDLCILDLDINDSRLGVITSGTYNSSTGVIVLTMTAAQTTFTTGNVTLSGLTGTGAFASLDGTWPSSNVSGSTITLQGPIGAGSATITGGTQVPAAYTNGLGTLITTCKTGGGDVLMVSGNPTQPATIPSATQAAYVAAAKAVAASNNVPFLDMWTNFGGANGWLVNQQTGWNAGYGVPADPYHLSMSGYDSYRTFVSQVLMQ